jgi:hypothetical protein
MQDTSKQATPGDPGTEAVVLLQLLRDDHEQPWTLAELKDALADVDPTAIAVSIERLHEQGVVRIDGKHITASPCARHLDDLGFVCI